ncbi:MAG: hypothetical protein IJN27_02875, partial [Oscillospiraceae bacterium]|nr:hypothetical protein [Oscillospiraceae bacterium]
WPRLQRSALLPENSVPHCFQAKPSRVRFLTKQLNKKTDSHSCLFLERVMGIENDTHYSSLQKTLIIGGFQYIFHRLF